jgi:hypothetical protein
MPPRAVLPKPAALALPELKQEASYLAASARISIFDVTSIYYTKV